MDTVLRPFFRRDFHDLPVDLSLQGDDRCLVPFRQSAYGLNVPHTGSIDLVAPIPAEQEGLHQNEPAFALFLRLGK
jgi:hypothetical protein